MAKEQKTYSGAPYNFIPFSAVVPKVAEKAGELPAHNEINDELLSGKIKLDITAVTDIFVGGSAQSNEGELFATDFRGREVIPGSTLRGLVRSNMQILGFSSVAGDVEDYAIMYRQVGSRGTKLARQYRDGILGVKTVPLGKGRQISLPLNVEAGYITCEKGAYYIYSAGKPIDEKTYGRMNYYSISEQVMLMDPRHFDIDLEKTQYIMEFKKGEREPSFRSRDDYAPYVEEVFFRPSGKTVSSVKRNTGGEEALSGYRKGYLVSTGFMNKKKAVYIIPVPEVSEIEKEKISLEDKDIIAFKRDYAGRKNTLHGTKCKDKGKKEQAREFYDLPAPGKTKPVFFMRYAGKTYFGFTPYARVFYDKTLYAGLPDEHKQSNRIDYVSSILGFSDSSNGESYKSRVFFEDAVIKKDKGDRAFSLVPGEPKLSSWYDYVVQDDRFGKTYNDDFELRGVKQYWLHKKAADSDKGSTNGEKAGDSDKRGRNEDVVVSFKAKRAGCSFSTDIHFKNLRKAELGLLLSCIYLGENYQQNIGRAKAYGFGRIDIAKPRVFLLDYKKMYSMLSLDVYEEIRDISGYVEAYKKEIWQKYKLSFDHLKDFYLMKDKERIPEEKAIRYMELPEYSNREEALPTVEQVLEGKRGQIIENAPSKSRKEGMQNGNKPHSNGKGQTAEKNVGAPCYSSASGKNLRKFTGQFLRYDRKTCTVFFQVNGKEKTERVSALKGLRYEKMKQGDDVIVEQQGNKFFLV